MALSREMTLLRLKRMEAALIRSQLANSEVLPADDYDLIRYALVLARLQAIRPGAVALERPEHSVVPDVELADEPLQTLREILLDLLYEPLREQRNLLVRLAQLRKLADRVRVATRDARLSLLAAHEGQFSADDLDKEVCHKVLVMIPGGGGGAGFVYSGFVARMQADGISPSYIVGASIGALLGGLMARDRQPDIPALIAWGKALKAPQIFSQPVVGPALSLPGLVRLHLRSMDEMLRNADGSPLRLKDLAIPYDAVVAGVKASAYASMPKFKPSRLHSTRLPMRIAERMLHMLSYFSPKVATEVLLGATSETHNVRVVDAIGLSSAIPGVLQYAPWQEDEQSIAILQAIREQQGLASFMDGGMVSNVPARAAWRSVEAGRIGRRNAYYLAMDCFGPQWGVGHTWLYPVTQMIQAQLPAQRPYYDWLVQFSKTPSPVNLLPSEEMFDMAYSSGWEQAEAVMPQLRAALKPIRMPSLD